MIQEVMTKILGKAKKGYTYNGVYPFFCIYTIYIFLLKAENTAIDALYVYGSKKVHI